MQAGEVEKALKQLATAAPGSLVEWCLKCGQIHIDKHVLSPGDTRCKEDLQTGTPAECIEAFRR